MNNNVEKLLLNARMILRLPQVRRGAISVLAGAVIAELASDFDSDVPKVVVIGQTVLLGFAGMIVTDAVCTAIDVILAKEDLKNFDEYYAQRKILDEVVETQ